MLALVGIYNQFQNSTKNRWASVYSYREQYKKLAKWQDGLMAVEYGMAWNVRWCHQAILVTPVASIQTQGFPHTLIWVMPVVSPPG